MGCKKISSEKKLNKKFGVAVDGLENPSIVKLNVAELEEWKRITRTDTYSSAMRILARIGAEVYKRRMGDLA